MKLVIIFCVCFAASLAVPAPVPDDDDHDEDQFDDQQQFRRRLQRLSLSLFDDTDKTRSPDRDDGRGRPGYADRVDRDDRRDHEVRINRDDRRDHEVRLDRVDTLDRHRNVQRELIDRRDLEDRRIRDNVQGSDRKDRVQQQDLDDKPDHGLHEERKDNDVLRKTHLDLLSNVLGRLTNKYQGHHGSLKISYNPLPLQQVRSPHPRVYDLGSLNFKYYAPAAPVYYHGPNLPSNEQHGPFLRELNQDRDDDDDDDDDDQLR